MSKFSNVIHYIKKLKNKNVLISVDAEKYSDRIQQPFIIKKILNKVCMGNIPEHIKAIFDKPTINIIINGMNAFPLNEEQDKDAHSCYFYLT